MTPERASELCATCGLCCRVVLAFMLKSESFRDNMVEREWASARGLIRAPARDRPGYQAWYIPSIYPKLDPATNRCTIYEDRPLACRVYDGRKDTDLACLWKDEV